MSRSRDVYFAAEPIDKIGNAILAKVNPYYSYGLLGPMGAVQAKAWMYFYGFGVEGLHASVVGRAGDIGELARVRVNHFRANVTNLVSLATAAPIQWEPQAAGWGAREVQEVKIAKAYCEHMWHNKSVNRYANLAAEASIAQAEGFIHQEFDPTKGEIYGYEDIGGKEYPVRTGDLVYENLQTQDVLRDPSAPSWLALDWVLCRTWRNRYEEAARWCLDAMRQGASEREVADLRDRILDAPQMAFANLTWTNPYGASGMTVTPWNSDLIEVWRFYHKPGAVLPMGRDVRMLGDGYVLDFRNLDIGQFPLARVSPGEVFNTPFGYTPAYDTLGMQEVYDSLQSARATNHTTLGVQSIAVEAGTRFDAEAYGGMATYEYPKGGKPPQPLQLTQDPSTMQNSLNDLKGNMSVVMGIDQAEASDRTSGSAIAIEDAKVLRKAGQFQKSFYAAVQDTGTISLKMIRAHATMPLKISLVGENKAAMVQQMEVDKDSIGSVDRVFVNIGTALSQSEGGRMQLAQTIAQMKPDDVSAKQLIEIATTGRLEPLTETTEEQYILIRREAELLSKGQNTPALIWDDHLLHGKENSSVLADPTLRKDPNVVKAVREHLHMHYSLYFGVPPEQVLTDPLYGVRMMTLCGQVPPPPAPPGMPGSVMGPNPAAATPPPAGGEMDATQPPAQGTPEAPPDRVNGGAPKPAQQPTNPLTGRKWNPVNAGGTGAEAPMKQ